MKDFVLADRLGDLVSNYGMNADLRKHLLTVPAATRDLQFHIAEIEGIVCAHLPPEARRFPNWWANQKTGKRPQAFAWMAAGWLVSKVDVDGNPVKFSRRRSNVEAKVERASV